MERNEPNSRAQWKSAVLSAEDADSADVEYWLQMTPDDRVAFAWELSEELFSLCPADLKNEQGLPGTIIRPKER